MMNSFQGPIGLDGPKGDPVSVHLISETLWMLLPSNSLFCAAVLWSHKLMYRITQPSTELWKCKLNKYSIFSLFPCEHRIHINRIISVVDSRDVSETMASPKICSHRLLWAVSSSAPRSIHSFFICVSVLETRWNILSTIFIWCRSKNVALEDRSERRVKCVDWEEPR